MMIISVMIMFFTQKTSLSVIRQKGESQGRGNKKTKHPNFPKNEHFLSPDTHI